MDARAAVAVVTRKGYAKRAEGREYPTQGRGGAGVITARLSEATGPLVAALVVRSTDLLLVYTDGKPWTGQAARVERQARATRGERLSIGAGDQVMRVLVARES